MEEKKIDIKVDENIAVGQYSNLAAIRHTKEEFIFDFAFLFPDGPNRKIGLPHFAQPRPCEEVYGSSPIQCQEI